MASYIGGVYTSGVTRYWNPGEAGEGYWVNDSESTDVYDHTDDFGNTGAAGGWERPGSMGTAGSQFPPPIALAPVDSAPAPFPGFKPVPRTATPEPQPEPESKTFWDRITPGSSTTPGEVLDGVEIPSLPNLLTPVLPAAGIFGQGLEGAAPAVKGVAALLPLIMIMMISKD